MKKTVCFVAAGSGGHILPAIVLAQNMYSLQSYDRFVFFTSAKNLDKNILKKYNFFEKLYFLSLINLPGKKLYLYPKFFLQFILIFFQSFINFCKIKPKIIITTGGLLAIPVCLAAKCLGVKIILYELNTTPGKAVAFLAPLASEINLIFEECTKHWINKPKILKRCRLTSYPVRFNKQDLMFDKKEVILQIDSKFDLTRKTIFIIGGSQGSKFLNDLFVCWVNNNLKMHEKIQVIHQTGSFGLSDISEFYKKLDIPAIVFDYSDQIKNYYLISDIVISRGGAGTLAELEFFKKRSIIIPLITKETDHQVNNALAFVKNNGDIFILQYQAELSRSVTNLDRNIKILV